jgi:hypothetical protein
MLGQKPSRTTKFNFAISSTNGENIDEEGLMDIVAFARLQKAFDKRAKTSLKRAGRCKTLTRAIFRFLLFFSLRPCFCINRTKRIYF